MTELGNALANTKATKAINDIVEAGTILSDELSPHLKLIAKRVTPILELIEGVVFGSFYHNHEEDEEGWFDHLKEAESKKPKKSPKKAPQPCKEKRQSTYKKHGKRGD